MSKTILSVIPFAALLVMACDQPGADAQKKQQTAEDNLTSARVEAQQKVETAESKADQQILKANADFTKQVADYRASREKDLADVDKDISDLQTKATTMRGDKQASANSALVSIRSQRASFANLVGSLDKATPSTFDSTKALIDKTYNDLEATIRKAP